MRLPADRPNSTVTGHTPPVYGLPACNNSHVEPFLSHQTTVSTLGLLLMPHIQIGIVRIQRPLNLSRCADNITNTKKRKKSQVKSSKKKSQLKKIS